MTGALPTPQRPWTRLRRRPSPGTQPAGAGQGLAGQAGLAVAQEPAWLYFLSGPAGREYPVSSRVRMGWPHGCDQCHQVIQPAASEGVLSFSVLRGRTPTTLYLCHACVGALCAAGGIPTPGQKGVNAVNAAGAESAGRA